jgi:hypothetical protein
MWPVTGRFLDALTGSHESISRVRAVAYGGFFASDPTSDDDPRFGVPLPDVDNPPLIAATSGEVKLTRTGEIRATASITTSGDRWALLQPTGTTLFIERGIDFGDGTQEYVPLGYFRVNELNQPNAPRGPIDVECQDRSAQALQNRTLAVYQIPEGMTHRTLFQWLINGNQGAGQSTNGYGMYIWRAVPITWDEGTYNPDTTTVVGKPVIEDGDVWAFLREVVDQQGCALRFDEAGGLRIEPLVPIDLTPVCDVYPGTGGNLIRASRSVTRDGIYNIVVAYGTDPAALVGRSFGYHNVANSPYRWALSHFGAVPRYLGSPLIRNGTQAQAAADTLVARTSRSTVALTLELVPNPALRPNDVLLVDLRDGSDPELRIVDDVTIPLAGSASMAVTTLPLASA